MWSHSIFPSASATGLSDLYFANVNLLEFLTFIFIRTRSSIKYFAKFITILNIAFLFYINSYIYGAQYAMLAVTFWGSFFLFFMFLRYFEQPGVQLWNPFGNNTPSYANPRVGY